MYLKGPLGWVVVAGVVVMAGWGTVVGTAAPGWEREQHTDSLRELDELFIEVRIGSALEGPTRRLLQSDVERRMREIPVRLLPTLPGDGPLPPAFIVEVAMLKTGRHTSTHFVTARLYQSVSLVRRSQPPVYAATWSVSRIGDGDLNSIREKIDTLVGMFLNDFHRVNPPTPPPS